MEKWSDSELVDSWSLDLSKTIAKMSTLAARARHGFVKPEEATENEQLRAKVSKLSSKVAKYEDALRQLKDDFQARADSYEGRVKSLEAKNSTLKVELERLQLDCTKRVDEARAEGEKAGFEGFLKSPAGIALVEKVRAYTKRVFTRSEEFCYMFVEGARFYFDYGVNEVEKWLASKGWTNKFNREEALKNAPEPPNLQFSEEDNRVNTLGTEAYIAHILVLGELDPNTEGPPLAEDHGAELTNLLDFDSPPRSSHPEGGALDTSDYDS